MMIACSVGQLVFMYKERIPCGMDIVVETYHSAFKISRAADALFIPPGQLRHYDLILCDEKSQMDFEVWTRIRISTALSELSPGRGLVATAPFTGPAAFRASFGVDACFLCGTIGAPRECQIVKTMELCILSNELNACKTTAILNPSRFVSHAAKLGLREGFAMDLTAARVNGTM